MLNNYDKENNREREKNKTHLGKKLGLNHRGGAANEAIKVRMH